MLMSMCALDLYPMYSRCFYSERRKEGKGEREGRERGREGERELSIVSHPVPTPTIIHTQL